MCWKSETPLRSLPPHQPIRLKRARRVILTATPHAMMTEGRISGALCLDQIEWAFDADDVEVSFLS